MWNLIWGAKLTWKFRNILKIIQQISTNHWLQWTNSQLQTRNQNLLKNIKLKIRQN